MTTTNRSVPIPRIEHVDGYRHLTIIRTGTVSFGYSYKTLVAVQSGLAADWVVHENIWGPTTGKHLNAIDGGSTRAQLHRLNEDQFADYLTEFCDDPQVTS